MSISSGGDGAQGRRKCFLSHDGLLCAGTGGRGLSSVARVVDADVLVGLVINAGSCARDIFSDSVGDARVVIVVAV